MTYCMTDDQNSSKPPDDPSATDTVSLPDPEYKVGPVTLR